MKILKRENWWIWFMLFLLSGGSSTLVLGALLDVYDKDAWYAKWQYWVVGLLLFIFPAVIMYSIFHIEILCKTAARLHVSGKEVYLSPYIWILLFIFPIFGWIFLSVMFIYLQVMVLVMLYRGAGERYIEN